MCSLMFTVIHRSLHNMIQLTSQLVNADHTLRLHKRIYSAIQRRDSEQSRTRMTEHLLDAQGLLARAHEQVLRSRLQDRLSHAAAHPVAIKTVAWKPTE